MGEQGHGQCQGGVCVCGGVILLRVDVGQMADNCVVFGLGVVLWLSLCLSACLLSLSLSGSLCRFVFRCL